MKKYLLIPMFALLCACDLFDDIYKDSSHMGKLAFGFYDENFQASKAVIPTGLDTNAFILTVKGPDESIIYKGRYGDSPESIMVESGTYYIKVESEEFSLPCFDSPQWGDEQYVKIEKGSSRKVDLICRQINCGIKLNIDPDFLTEYPDGALRLKSMEGGLNYGYKEKRVAYFKPGVINLVLSRGAKDETLLTRSMMSNEILVLNINVATGNKTESASGNHISIQVDTTRNYLSETFTIGAGGADKGSTPETAYSISQAKAMVGKTGVWVSAYIVGGDMTSKAMSFTVPFSSATHIGIGPRSSTTEKESCMSVELKSGAIRDALNLQTNPENLGRHIYLKGDIVASYFGIVGLKNIKEYQLK